ncbi:MAG: amino acid permease [Bacteroidota bacterium]
MAKHNLKRLKKELKLIDVYVIATGTTLSAGFFILPGLAAQQAGSAFILSYIIAAVALIPAVFSIIELATAMPRAGGVYYFLDRSLGPLVGTIGGIGTWMALILKVAFALIGIGAYCKLFFPEIEITPIAIGISFVLGIISLLGAKKTGGFQIILVLGLIVILALFISFGIPEIQFARLSGIFDVEFMSIIETAGLVYISYAGITKITSLSEEVENPERNLSLGIFLALGTAIVVYVLGTIVITGVMPLAELKGNITPIASAAKYIFGEYGAVALSVAAVLAFVSLANAGILSASRFPLAMSRDHIIPQIFSRLTKSSTPAYSIIATVISIVVILLVFDPMGIAKLASAFQLLMFALVCLAVIIMRESGINSYDPGYKSPFYPWMQLFGIVISIYLIVVMGILPILFSAGLVIISVVWYWFYSRTRVSRNGAIYHIFERLGQQRHHGLDAELRGILKEKGLRKDDPFDEIVSRSKVLEIGKDEFENVVNRVAEYLDTILPLTAEEITKQIMEGTRLGATPVMRGVALPHFRVSDITHPEMVLVRSKEGVTVGHFNPLTHQEESLETVHAIFFLVSPERDPTQHLRILAQIAGRVDEDSFTTDWADAADEQELKEALLRDENFHSLFICTGSKTEVMVNKQIKEVKLPSGCLVTLLRRNAIIIVPKGGTVLKEGDRLTIIGDPASIKDLQKMYVH